MAICVRIVTLKHSEAAHDVDPRTAPAQVRHSRQRRETIQWRAPPESSLPDRSDSRRNR